MISDIFCYFKVNLKFFLRVCVYEANLYSQFSPFIIWILGIKLGYQA